MKLQEFAQQTLDTVWSWHTNHTDFGAFVEWRECWWLPNELLEDADTASELGWTLEEIQFDSDTYYDEYMKWYWQGQVNHCGTLMPKVIERVEQVLNDLQSSDILDCLVGLVQAVHLAHGNGSLLRDYFVGDRTIIESISQNGLEATFPDLDEFITNYQPMEVTYE